MFKTVVVTGAAGFLGRHVAREFAQAGSEVIGIGHGEWRESEWTMWGISRWRRADVSLAELRALDVVPDAVLHCAGSGSVPRSITDPLYDFQSSVGTTAEVLEYIRVYCPQAKFVLASSAAVYGNASVSPIEEANLVRPVSPYGVHKSINEQLARSYAETFGVSAAIVRYFSIYGIGLRKQLLWDASRKFAQGDAVFPGTGEEKRDFIHVDDAAHLMRFACDLACAACPTMNGGAGTGRTVREVLSALQSAINGGDLPIVFTRVTRAGDPLELVADTSVSAGLGWRPQRDLFEMIAAYASWWKAEYRSIGQGDGKSGC